MPQQFQDNAGRTYTVSMTLGKFRAIREVYPVDVFEQQSWTAICGSLTERLAILWYLVQDQAESFGLDLDGWERALMGPGIANQASEAFMDEMENFFRQFDQPEMAKMTSANRASRRKALDLVNSPGFDKMVGRLDQAFQALSGLTPEPLETETEKPDPPLPPETAEPGPLPPAASAG